MHRLDVCLQQHMLLPLWCLFAYLLLVYCSSTTVGVLLPCRAHIHLHAAAQIACPAVCIEGVEVIATCQGTHC